MRSSSRLVIVVFSLLIVFKGLASSAPTPAPIDIQESLFSDAQQYYDHKAYERAVSAFQEFVAQYPEDPRTPLAYFLMGEALAALKRYNDAVDPLRTVVDEYPGAAFTSDARIRLSEVYLELGRLDDAIPILEREAALSRDSLARRELYLRMAQLYLSKQKGPEAIETLLKLLQLSKEAGERELARDEIQAAIETDLDSGQLERIYRKYPKSYPGDLALLRLSQSEFDRDDLFRAEQHLNEYLKNFPGHKRSEHARQLLTAILETNQSYQFRIGALLPLQGAQAPYAESVLKGIQLAMEDAALMFPDKYVGLVIRDIGDSPSRLTNAMEELVREYQAVGIVGPLLTKDVQVVAPLAERHRVPLISPTATGFSMAQQNRYIFRDTVTLRYIGRTLTQYAMLKAGLKRFVIFYPNDHYGLQMMRILSEEVNRLDGEIIAAEPYPPEASDFASEIRRVVKLDLARYGVLVPPADAEKNQKPEYMPGFDGVILLGDALKTGLLAAQLAFNDIKDPTILVSHGGNSSEFLKAGSRYVEGAIVVDPFFEGSSDPIVRNFVSRYEAKYQESPDLFAAQAYDCIQMFLLSLKSGASQREQIRDYIAQVRDFHGASGITTFLPEGQVQKRLFVIQVQNGNLVQVN